MRSLTHIVVRPSRVKAKIMRRHSKIEGDPKRVGKGWQRGGGGEGPLVGWGFDILGPNSNTGSKTDVPSLENMAEHFELILQKFLTL